MSVPTVPGHTIPNLLKDGTFVDLRLSNSKLGTYRRCPKKYEFKYVMGLRSKRKARPLELGSWVHELLEHWYGAMIPGVAPDLYNYRQVHRDRTAEFNSMFNEEKEDLGDLPRDALALFKGYLRRYGLEDKRRWEIIDVELDEIITLPNGLKFQIIIDLIVREPDGGVWIVDHKNVSRFLETDFLLLDAQLTRYYWGAEHMGYGPIRGIMFNQIKTKAPTLPKVLQDGTLEKRANLQCDHFTYIDQCKAHGVDVTEPKTAAFISKLRARQDDWWLRRRLPKDDPVVKQQMAELYMGAREIVRAERRDEFPRASSKDCTFDCEFKEACQVGLLGGDIDPIIKLKFTDKRKETDL